MARPPVHSRYQYTPERDALLRDTYAQARTRRELAEGLAEFRRLTGISPSSTARRCIDLGLCWITKKAWTDAEMLYLREKVREMPVTAIAKNLHRSLDSVKIRLRRMRESYRVSREGYTQVDIGWLLGVSEATVRQWLARGWLRRREGMITVYCVRVFLYRHLMDISLARCDQMWLKGELSALLRAPAGCADNDFDQKRDEETHANED
jgi:hypothetical protein